MGTILIYRITHLLRNVQFSKALWNENVILKYISEEKEEWNRHKKENSKTNSIKELATL